jgi:hypothetical protein
MIVLSVKTDLKTGQKVQRVRLASGAKLRIFGEISFDVKQMHALAQLGVDLIKERVSRGVGSSDTAMPGLKRHYAIRKTRAGAGNRRNLRLTGAMLDNLTVRSVSASQARMDITSARERIKARANEKRAPWFGWSARDLAALAKAGEQLFRLNVADMGLGKVTRGRFGQSTVFLSSIRGGRFGDGLRRAA